MISWLAPPPSAGAPAKLLEEIARSETEDLARRSLERRLGPPGPLQAHGRLRMALAQENRPPLDRARLHPGVPHPRAQSHRLWNQWARKNDDYEKYRPRRRARRLL